ncbi:hypothetical protein [Tessaracoccus sp.]
MSFYRTVYRIEVLSNTPAPEGLEDVVQEITAGDMSGAFTKTSEEIVTPEQIRELLAAHGTDPTFLNAHAKG